MIPYIRKYIDRRNKCFKVSHAPRRKTEMQLSNHKSWSKWFNRSCVHRRFILKQSPHAAHSWCQSLKPKVHVNLPEITCHAPWLNGLAIAHREAVGMIKINGYFIG